MKVLIFVNNDKDPNGSILKKLKNALDNNGVEYSAYVNGEKESQTNSNCDAIFVIGGDGTLLRRAEYANKYGIPLIGINAGKLGFLNEFEQAEIDEAVNLFVNNQLVKDLRTTINVTFKGKTFTALNDVVVQRTYLDSKSSIVGVNVYIDENHVDKVRGDGIIVATPTGSTAYSLSAGGSILAPGINAFIITPIAAHSFSQRPIIYSSESKAKIEFLSTASAGLIIDGNLVDSLNNKEYIEIVTAKKPTIFLRRKGFNFYKRLSAKFKDRSDENL